VGSRDGSTRLATSSTSRARPAPTKAAENNAGFRDPG
jgi:hypothetical protein